MAIAATVVVSTLVTLLAGAYLTRRSLEREGIRSLARQVDLIAAQRAEKGIARRGEPNLGDFLATEQERLAILAPEQADLLLPASAVTAIRAQRVATGTLDLRGMRYLYAARRNGPEALVLLRSARKQSADWTPFVAGLAIAAGISVVLAAIVAFALARAIARPITRVADASRRLAAGEDPEPLVVRGADEVAALAASFNHLASELAHAQDAERSFLLSVSHELKTPLTVIRGHAEALQDGILDERQAGDVIEREAGRLERLIRDLLDLARLRRRTFAVGHTDVDLGDVAREVVSRFQPLSRRFDVALSVVAEPDAVAAGDHDRVLQAVSNLVENALRCARAGGAVRILAAPGRIDVVDDGPGLGRRRPRARLRALLPLRAPRSRPPGGHGARARDRARAGRGDGRQRRAPQHARRRLDVLRAPACRCAEHGRLRFSDVRTDDVPMSLPGAEQLAPGLTRWVVYHPEWKQDVGCVKYTDGTELVLIDPMLPAEPAAARRFRTALDREVRATPGPLHVLVTVHWHERHAPEIVKRYAGAHGAELWAPALAVPRLSYAPEHPFAAGDRLPAGVVAFETLRGDEVVLWLPGAKAIVAGDVLLGGKRKPLRVCPQSWLPRGVPRKKLASSLASLAELPVELVVPAHGDPIRENAHAVLEKAIADAARG